jgi:hypothetical protein
MAPTATSAFRSLGPDPIGDGQGGEFRRRSRAKARDDPERGGRRFEGGNRMAQSVQDLQSAPNLAARIESMFGRDKIFAWGFVVALWATVAFVLLSVNSLIPSNGIRIASWIAALVLLVFNTTSIGAMVRHYSHDKPHIYGIDIKHLDAGR